MALIEFSFIPHSERRAGTSPFVRKVAQGHVVRLRCTTDGLGE